MQSKTTRGLRRLLVSTGVISLVLSVASPAALAEKPKLAGTQGAQMVQVCHNGRVLEMEQAALQAHLNHGDARLDLDEGARCPSTDGPSDGLDTPETVPFVKVCLDGTVDEITEAQVEELASLIFVSETPLEELGLGEVCATDLVEEIPGQSDGAMLVEVCHEGEVLEVEEDAVDGHLGHGDVLVVDGACPKTVVDDGGLIVPPGSVIVDDTTPKVEVKPGKEENDEVKPEPEQKPAPVISTVTVTRPAPAAPAAPAAPTVPATPAAPAAPQAPAAKSVTNTPTAPTPSVAVSATSRGNEVLGSVTTRTPGGAQVTALAATGTSTTVALAALGAVLLLAGFGLQVTARRVQSTAVGA